MQPSASKLPSDAGKELDDVRILKEVRVKRESGSRSASGPQGLTFYESHSQTC